MWELLEVFWPGVHEEPETIQILLMIAIVIVLIGFGYMFAKTREVRYLAIGLGIILALAGTIWVVGRTSGE